jgi:anti-sigma B factor antagonist
MQAREHIDENGVHVVELSGEVDLHHSPRLREVLLAHADAKRPVLLLDLSEVSYIDSSGLATMIEYLQKALKYKGRFALTGVSERLRTIFDLRPVGRDFRHSSDCSRGEGCPLLTQARERLVRSQPGDFLLGGAGTVQEGGPGVSGKRSDRWCSSVCAHGRWRPWLRFPSG